MKALKLLKEFHPSVGIFHIPYGEAIKEAIEELEEAMKLKTCGECEYLDGVICRHDRGLYCVRQFEADYYEPKDNA